MLCYIMLYIYKISINIIWIVTKNSGTIYTIKSLSCQEKQKCFTKVFRVLHNVSRSPCYGVYSSQRIQFKCK